MQTFYIAIERHHAIHQRVEEITLHAGAQQRIAKVARSQRLQIPIAFLPDRMC